MSGHLRELAGRENFLRKRTFGKELSGSNYHQEVGRFSCSGSAIQWLGRRRQLRVGAFDEFGKCA